MDAYFKINLLEARMKGLMKEINRLEGVKDFYHAEGNLIEISIQKASIRLYNNSEIISQLRYNNSERFCSQCGIEQSLRKCKLRRSKYLSSRNSD